MDTFDLGTTVTSDSKKEDANTADATAVATEAADDPWGSFGATKKDKKKKKQSAFAWDAEPEPTPEAAPEPVPEPVAETPAPPAEEDWGFATSGKKKKKKGKVCEPSPVSHYSFSCWRIVICRGRRIA